VVSLDIGPAGQHDTKACQSLVYCIPKYVKVTADKGYDDQKLRKWLSKRKIESILF
jgi:IS5 family transposase